MSGFFLTVSRRVNSGSGVLMGSIQILTLIVFCIVSDTWVFAQPIEAESVIKAVKLFPDSAIVTRQLSVMLPAGSSAVRIGPLPGTLDSSSISARGVGQVDVTLQSVNVLTEQQEKVPNPEVQSLEGAIRNIVLHQRRTKNLQQALAKERQYLDSIQVASAEQISEILVTQLPSADDAETLLGFLHSALLDNYDRDEQAHIELERLEVELGELQQDLARLTRGSEQQYKWVILELKANEGGISNLEISYHVPDVSWQPIYEARVSTAKEEINLISYGDVRQRTGEDWSGVSLTLSVSKPNVEGALPDLQPWVLNSNEASSETTGNQQGDSDLSVAADFGKSPSVTYRLSKPVTLLSNWQSQKIPLGSEQFTAEFDYEVTPRLLKHAFLRVRATNISENFYLPGDVAVFLEGDYIAKAHLNLVAPGEVFDLYLGVAERVSVSREQVKALVEVGTIPGLRDEMKSIDYEYLTIVENFTSGKINIIIYDQYPVSGRKEITVESIRFSPEAVEKDADKPGIIHWELELLPGQKEELRLSYRVRHPVDMKIR